MKKSQWVFAAVVFAGLISLVTYAMNYLGGSGQDGLNGIANRLFPQQ